MSEATPLPFGTALALAQRTLTAPLVAVLSAEGVPMPQWFTLNALGLRGPASPEVLTDLLAGNGLDAAAAQDLLDDLDGQGLVVNREGMVSLTAAGTTRYTGLRDRIGAVTARIFEQFDAARVETTRSLLQEIAQVDPEELTRRTVPVG